MKTYRNLKLILAFAASAVALWTPAIKATPFVYNDGDLTLAFRQTGGSSPDLVIDIGPASTYDNLSVGSSIPVANLTTTLLNAAYPNLNSLSWSVSGAVRNPTNVAYALQTVWATAPRANTNTQSSAWLRKSQFGQGGYSGAFAAVANNAATYSSVQPASSSNSVTAVLVPSSDPNAYTPLVRGLDDPAVSDFQGNFQGNVENKTAANFASSQTVSRSDLYRLVPGTSAGGTVNTSAALVGYFDFKPNGTLTFTAGPTAPPQPSITGIQGGGNVFTVSFITTAGAIYRLRSTALAGLGLPRSSWQTNSVTIAGTGSVQTLQDTNATAGRFYAVEAFH